jgi:HTH domain
MAKQDFTPKKPRADAARANQRMLHVAQLLKRDPPLSQRAIAREFGCHEKTVRLDIEKLDQLDSADRERILAGEPAHPILKSARQRKKVSAEEKQALEIDSIVGVIFQCLAKPQRLGDYSETMRWSCRKRTRSKY